MCEGKSGELLELLCCAREDDEHFFGGSDGYLLYIFFSLVYLRTRRVGNQPFLLTQERWLNGSNSVAVTMRRRELESREEGGALHRTIVSRGLCPAPSFLFIFSHFVSASCRQQVSATSKVALTDLFVLFIHWTHGNQIRHQKKRRLHFIYRK